MIVAMGPTSASAPADGPDDLEAVLDDGTLTRHEPGERSMIGSTVGLDSISKAIIEQLQTDGRRAYARIATRSGSPRPRSDSG